MSFHQNTPWQSEGRQSALWSKRPLTTYRYRLFMRYFCTSPSRAISPAWHCSALSWFRHRCRDKSKSDYAYKGNARIAMLLSAARRILTVSHHARPLRALSSCCMQLQAHQGHYTPITKQLWIDRIESASKHQTDLVTEPITSKPPEVTTVTYDFSRDEALKELYRNPWNFIRIGWARDSGHRC